MPEVTRTCRPRRVRRSTTGRSASVSPMLAPCSQARRAMRALPPGDAAPLAEARPVLLAAAHAPQEGPRRRPARARRGRRDRGAAAAAAAASCGRRCRMRGFQRRAGVRARRQARRRAHARGRARARRHAGPPRRRARRRRRRRRSARRAPSRRGRRAGRGSRGPSSGRSKRRLVTTATGTIGRPESCASVTMPSPQTRAIFGTSAVSTTISPSASARSISRVAGDAALLAHVAAARAGAADGAHAEMAQRDRVELAVAGARDEARGAVLRALGEMDHEVLPVPHGGDDRHQRPDVVVGVRRLHDAAVGAPHEAEIARRRRTPASRWTARVRLRRLSHSIVRACQAGPGSSSRCRWTMK